MALIRCRECGEVVSSLVSLCPTCRAPMRSTAAAPAPLPTESRRARRVQPMAASALIRRHSHFPNGPGR